MPISSMLKLLSPTKYEYRISWTRSIISRMLCHAGERHEAKHNFSPWSFLHSPFLVSRLNPSGLGRNMSLFLVMKRYDCSLREYLAMPNEGGVSWRTSLLLLTQLLEGITHLVYHRVAHRDLKTDNLLVDLSGGREFPKLVITDFGCCLADERNGLCLPYNSEYIMKGGNVLLMAPEVSSASPGTFAYIDYSKADVFAAGAIAYEIFGQANPLYGDKRLDASNRDLPDIPNAPEVITRLVHDMLRRNPNNRLSAELAATICQLLLWAPSSWWKTTERVLSTQEILQWALTLTTKVLCESRFPNSGAPLHEYQMVSTFLRRLSLKRIKEAVSWIHNNC